MAGRFYIPLFRTFNQKNGAGKTDEDIAIKCMDLLSLVSNLLRSLKTRVDLPRGQMKFSTFEVDTRNASSPTVTTRVYIDGHEAWKYV
jgi:alkaline phosphatase D